MQSKLKLMLAAGVLFSTAGYAAAQDTIVITPEQRTVVREYVVREHVDPAPSIDYDITVGSIIPDTIEVRKLGVSDLGRDYDYVYTDRGTVLVEPGSRRVIEVIE